MSTAKKKTRSRGKPVPSTSGPIPVRFLLCRVPAHHVALAGSFNDWQPAHLNLSDAEAANWELELPLPAGAHEYLFVVDGRWIPDPENPRTVPNPFGGNNSVIEVGGTA